LTITFCSQNSRVKCEVWSKNNATKCSNRTKLSTMDSVSQIEQKYWKQTNVDCTYTDGLVRADNDNHINKKKFT
jgi:hypothetical protein